MPFFLYIKREIIICKFDLRNLKDIEYVVFGELTFYLFDSSFKACSAHNFNWQQFHYQLRDFVRNAQSLNAACVWLGNLDTNLGDLGLGREHVSNESLKRCLHFKKWKQKKVLVPNNLNDPNSTIKDPKYAKRNDFPWKYNKLSSDESYKTSWGKYVDYWFKYYKNNNADS